ncbi:GAF and ANTAR domain-containing protein [Lacisediminihabitans changchengi]|uniref:GAF and ANTAR domain-containing protein n=1 Tax=Lacisediminihabitans changchengi TaxID=2787634 RepID=A0A934W2N8_9MICO|nr:GAF and ANTAR domain-containing protein [Lacisediminihabitans changchengi]MBK4347026.1 GAF and ANTAR domain-containing protein [Lacisediminihabitans changchengi]MBK4347851.1 GAF and ANTAR domain-containing protein [Lacisediminihabitans changchengi]
MVTESREERLVGAFVRLADTLVAGYDVVDLLQTLIESSAQLLDASAAGLMLADDKGELALVAATSERSRLVEMMQLSSGNGPCLEAFVCGEVVVVSDIAAEAARWPEFAEEALAQGFRSIHCVPMRLRGSIIGTVNLFRAATGSLTAVDAAAAQGLADVATIGILQERAIRESEVAREQLQNALESRVVIEQAKGVIAQLRAVDMDLAFTLLRAHARNTGRNLRDVAADVVDRSLAL